MRALNLCHQSALFVQVESKWPNVGRFLVYSLFSFFLQQRIFRKMGNIGMHSFYVAYFTVTSMQFDHSIILIPLISIVSKSFSRSINSPDSGMTDYFEDFGDDTSDTYHKVNEYKAILLQTQGLTDNNFKIKKHLLKKQLIDYMKNLTRHREQLGDLEDSFLR